MSSIPSRPTTFALGGGKGGLTIHKIRTTDYCSESRGHCSAELHILPALICGKLLHEAVAANRWARTAAPGSGMSVAVSAHYIEEGSPRATSAPVLDVLGDSEAIIGHRERTPFSFDQLGWSRRSPELTEPFCCIDRPLGLLGAEVERCTRLTF